MTFSVPFKCYLSLRYKSEPPRPRKGAKGGGEWGTARTRREMGTTRAREIQARRRSAPPPGPAQRTRTRALLAVSHVGSTARRVMVPAVTTWGRMAP